MTNDFPSLRELEALRQEFEKATAAADIRYQQRFEAQTNAIDAALKASNEAIKAALIATEKAVLKAEIATEKRFESVNEFRQQLSDQTNTFLPKAEFNRAHDALVEKIAILYTFKDTTAGLIGKIDAMALRQEQSKGKSEGASIVWVLLVGVLTLVATFVTSFVVVVR